MVVFVFVMFVAAGCALLLYSLSILSPILKGGPGIDSGRALFDTSRGAREARRTFDVLTMALAQSSTDAEFEASFRRILRPCTDREIQNSWVLLMPKLREHGTRSHSTQPLRECAKRYVCELSHQYDMR